MADRPAKVCKLDECAMPRMGRGLCAMHYSRLMRYGDLNVSYGVRRDCPICGKEFGVRSRQRTCSPECSREFKLRYSRAYAAKRRAANPVIPKVDEFRQCDFCGTAFGANQRRSRYCSDVCADANKNRANWPYVTRRRARLRGATVELFDRIEIFERDNWTCGICGVGIERDVSFPDPQSASLDHVFPLAHGGTHSRANAQAAHLGCNSRKGAKVA